MAKDNSDPCAEPRGNSSTIGRSCALSDIGRQPLPFDIELRPKLATCIVTS